MLKLVLKTTGTISKAFQNVNRFKYNLQPLNTFNSLNFRSFHSFNFGKYKSPFIGNSFILNNLHQNKQKYGSNHKFHAIFFGVGASAAIFAGQYNYSYIAKGETKKESTEEELKQLDELEKKIQSKGKQNLFSKILFAIRLGIRTIVLFAIFTPLLLSLPLLYIVTRERFHMESIKKSIWTLLRKTLEIAGPCWIKLGQWASTRPDLFSKSFCEHIATLQDRAPTHVFNKTIVTLKQAYGNAFKEIFSYFEETPVASGAITQVHRAKLKKNNKLVAVKILHPDTQMKVAVDISILKFLAKMSNLIPGVEFMSIVEAVDDFSKNMLAQVYLLNEAKNLLKFRKNFAESPEIIFPKPEVEYCRSTVLVESFEHGIPVSEFMYSNSIDKKFNKQIADIGMNAYMKMMLVDHYVHADLHPGNVLVRINGNSRLPKVQLVLLDVGLVTEMSPSDSEHFVELFKAVVNGDGEYGSRLMIEHSRAPPKWRSPESKEKFVTGMASLFKEVRHKKISEIDVGYFLSSVLSLMRNNGVKIEGNFSTLCLSTVLLDGMGRQLNPEMSLLDAAVPFLFKNKTDIGWLELVRLWFANLKATILSA